jgi:hypothetical protein
LLDEKAVAAAKGEARLAYFAKFNGIHASCTCNTWVEMNEINSCATISV